MWVGFIGMLLISASLFDAENVTRQNRKDVAVDVESLNRTFHRGGLLQLIAVTDNRRANIKRQDSSDISSRRGTATTKSRRRRRNNRQRGTSASVRRRSRLYRSPISVTCH